jgi:hypothetical protein
MLAKSHSIDIQEEALWVLCNSLTTATHEHVRGAFLLPYSDGLEQDSFGEIAEVLLKGLKQKSSRLV